MRDPFIQCWTCKFLVYDLTEGNKCAKTGKVMSDYQSVLPTDCKEWTR